MHIYAVESADDIKDSVVVFSPLPAVAFMPYFLIR